MEQPVRAGRGRWAATGLLVGAGGLNLEARLIPFAVVPLLRRDLGLTDVAAGSLMSLFLWTYAVCSPLAGYLGDRFSRRRVLIGSLAGSSAATLVAALAGSAGQLLASRFLLALAQCFFIPATMALIADYHPRQARGRAVGLLTSGGALAPIAFGAAAGWVGEHYGWRWALGGFAAIGGAYCLVLLRWVREVQPGASEAAEPAPAAEAPASLASAFGQLLRIRSFVCLGLVSGTTSIAVWMLNTWLAVFLFETFRMTLAQSGFLGNLAVTGAGMVGTFCGGFLSDAVAGRQPARRMLLFAIFLGLAAPFPLLFWKAGSAAAVLGATAAFMCFRALGECNWHPTMYELVRPDMRSTATGFTNAFNCVTGGAGALVAGYYKSSLGLQVVFGLVSVVIACAAGILFLAYFVFLDRDLARAREAPAPGSLLAEA